MKKLLLLSVIIYLFASQLTAQNPITTLVHADTTTPYYGQNSLVDAYNASVDGDYLYLSTGFFTAPSGIAKGVKIIGAGHFPDSANVAKRTYIFANFDGGGLSININAGADSLRLEGLYINGVVKYAASSSINSVIITRCRFQGASFPTSTIDASKKYCSFEECFVDGSIYFEKFVASFMITHSIISGTLYYLNGGALIDGNIFTTSGNPIVANLSSIMKNNIFLSGSDPSNCRNNIFSNNLFVKSSPNLEDNYYYNNYTSIAQPNIFVNQTGNSIDYTHDYHLKSPTTYIGTDGTQVGLYGGTTPFKDKGAPSNPQILTKTVDDQTDTNGNLQINFKVKAQDN